MHDVLVRDVRVGEDDVVDPSRWTTSSASLLLLDDRDAVGIERAGERRRIPPAGDAGDLGRRERDDLGARVVAVDGVEVVEVTARRAHDHDAASCLDSDPSWTPLYGRGAAGYRGWTGSPGIRPVQPAGATSYPASEIAWEICVQADLAGVEDHLDLGVGVARRTRGDALEALQRLA